MANARADFELSDEEVIKYVQNCFSENAKRFFDNDDRFKTTNTVSIVFALMRFCLMPPASRAAIRTLLDTLSHAKELRDSNPREPLDSLCKTIEMRMLPCSAMRLSDRDRDSIFQRQQKNKENGCRRHRATECSTLPSQFKRACLSQ